MNFLQQNWPLKLLSLTIAIVVAVYVERSQNLASATLSLPAVLPAREGHRVAEPPAGTSIQVRLEGPAEVVQAIEPSDLALRWETANIRANRSIRVPVLVELVEKYRNRVTANWSPRALMVRYDSDEARRFTVQLQEMNELPGFRYEQNPAATPAEVFVRGPAGAVRQVASVRASWVRGSSMNLEQIVTVHALDREGKDISDLVQIDPPHVRVNAVQVPRLSRKRVMVEVLCELRPGYEIAATATPNRVWVIGGEESLARMQSVQTEHISLPRGETRIRRNVLLRQPATDVRVETPQVQVELTLAPVRGGAARPRAN